MKLRTTTDIVKQILIENEQARNSDSYLYLKVLSVVGKRNGIDIDKMSITTFLMNMRNYGFPPFESVRRARQKIQAAHNELAGCDSVEAQRKVLEQEYRNYARQVNV